LATDRHTNKLTDKQMDRLIALSRSRCREWRLNNIKSWQFTENHDKTSRSRYSRLRC